MRIYTRIEMEMRTGRVLHACSSEYAGPIAWLKGGKGGGSSTTNISSEPDQGIQCPHGFGCGTSARPFRSVL